MVLSIAMFIRDCSSIGKVKCFFLASSITLWSLNSNLVAKLVGHSEHWIGLLAAVWRFSMCRSKLNRFFNSVPQWLHFIFLVESLHLFCLMCRSIANLEWSSLSHLAHLRVRFVLCTRFLWFLSVCFNVYFCGQWGHGHTVFLGLAIMINFWACNGNKLSKPYDIYSMFNLVESINSASCLTS